jgi:long-chain-fatty-acid coA ligase
MTFVGVLEEIVACYREREAFICRDTESGDLSSVSFEEFWTSVSSAATYWTEKRKALPQNEPFRVGIAADNSYPYFVEYLGVIAAGGVFVPLNQSFGAERVLEFAAEIGIPYMLAGAAQLADSEYAAELTAAYPPGRLLPLDEVFAASEQCEPLKDLHKGEPDDTILMLLSSGTSGRSKIVEITNENLSAYPNEVFEQLRPARESGELHHYENLIVLPLFHIGGVIPIVGELARGNSLLISNARQFLQDLGTRKFEKLIVAPAMMKRILERAEKNAKVAQTLQTVREVLCLGAAMSPVLIQALHDRDILPRTYYGLTETTGTVTYRGPYRDGACCTVADFCEIKIEDEEICVRGKNVMKGYYKNPEATAEAIRDGWFHTGDLGRIDEDGYLYVTGRRKNIIVLSNGENVSPEVLEDKLYACPLIDECVVCADGEEIAANIFSVAAAADETKAEEIRAFVKQLNRRLPRVEQIRKLNLSAEELPKNSTGKLLR